MPRFSEIEGSAVRSLVQGPGLRVKNVGLVGHLDKRHCEEVTTGRFDSFMLSCRQMILSIR